MSFWQPKPNVVIDGSEQNSFWKEFSLIPNNTMAVAKIIKFELLQFTDKQTGKIDKKYQIIWKLLEGDFKNRQVSQKIKAFDPSPEKVIRAINMLFRIYHLCGIKPLHQNAPSNEDLEPMIGEILGIKIQEFHGNGTSINWVSEVHALNSNFKVQTGIPMIIATKKDFIFEVEPPRSNYGILPAEPLSGAKSDGSNVFYDEQGNQCVFDDKIPF